MCVYIYIYMYKIYTAQNLAPWPRTEKFLPSRTNALFNKEMSSFM